MGRWWDFTTGSSSAHPNDPHPELSPATPKDSYRYLKMAPSSLGLDYWELYKYMTQPDRPDSEYVQASAALGTAIHRYIQADMMKKGMATQAEVLVTDPALGMAGYIDYISAAGGVGEIKTVGPGRFKAIAKSGVPYPTHASQVRSYMAMTGRTDTPANITYFNRENLKQSVSYEVDWNSAAYLADIQKLQSVRRRVQNEIQQGKLDLSDLPRASSIKALQKEAEDTAGELSSQSDNLSELWGTYQDELDWINSTSRGMPSSIPNRQPFTRPSRSRQRRRRVYDGGASTVGLGFQLFNNANKHYEY